MVIINSGPLFEIEKLLSTQDVYLVLRSLQKVWKKTNLTQLLHILFKNLSPCSGVFENVDFLMKPEAFAKQLHLNHKKILKLFLLKFSNFNVNFYNFSNLKKKIQLMFLLLIFIQPSYNIYFLFIFNFK